jgi:hypothetical protein
MITGSGCLSSQVVQASLPGFADEPILPKETICGNASCFANGMVVASHSKFCSECGKELEVRVADMYIPISLNEKASRPYTLGPSKRSSHWPQDPIVPQDPTKAESEPTEREHNVSIREFIKILRKYEKEVFVEDI